MAAKRKPSWRRKYMRGRKGFAKAVKNVILKTAETKYISRLLTDTSMSELGAPTRFDFRHNTLEWINIFNNTNPDAVKHPLPVQGDGDGNRNGDEIYATGIRIAGELNAASANKGMKVRVFLVEYNDQVFGAGQSLSTKAAVQHVITGNIMLDTFQHDRIKPKYLGTVRFPRNDLNDASDVTTNFKYWIPLKRKITFRQDDSPALARGIKNKMALLFLPYNTLFTADGIVIGAMKVHATLYYKDP